MPEETSTEALKILADVYPDKPMSELASALRVTNGNTEEAVNLLLDVSDPNQNDTPSSSLDAADPLTFPTSEQVELTLKSFAAN